VITSQDTARGDACRLQRVAPRDRFGCLPRIGAA